jgi:hypothetical protein
VRLSALLSTNHFMQDSYGIVRAMRSHMNRCSSALVIWGVNGCNIFESFLKSPLVSMPYEIYLSGGVVLWRTRMVIVNPNPPCNLRERGAKRGTGLPASRANERTFEVLGGAPNEKGRGSPVPRFDDKARELRGGLGSSAKRIKSSAVRGFLSVYSDLGAPVDTLSGPCYKRP